MTITTPRKPMGLVANEAQRLRVRRKLEVLSAFLRNHPASSLSPRSTYRGVAIGSFAKSCRFRYRKGDLSPWLTAALEATPGWTWDSPRSPHDAMPNVKRLREYVRMHGWSGISGSTVIDGSPIGDWILNCRSAYRKGRLSENMRVGLEAIPGWTWESPSRRDPYPNVTLLRAYVRKHGWGGIRNPTVIDGRPIGRWITNVRAEYRRGRLTKGLTDALKSIPGWSWGTSRARHLRRVLAGIRRFVNLHGWAAITMDTVIEGVQADLWLDSRRAAYREGRLPLWLKNGLAVLPGWSWTAKPERRNYRDMPTLLAEYVAVHGWADLQWDTTFRSARIGSYAQESILRDREDRLPEATRKALEAIPGWNWGRDVSVASDPRMLRELKDHLRTEGWRRIHEWTKFQETGLGRWLRFCRSRLKRGALPVGLRRSLERIPGWTWEFKRSGKHTR